MEVKCHWGNNSSPFQRRFPLSSIPLAAAWRRKGEGGWMQVCYSQIGLTRSKQKFVFWHLIKERCVACVSMSAFLTVHPRPAVTTNPYIWWIFIIQGQFAWLQCQQRAAASRYKYLSRCHQLRGCTSQPLTWTASSSFKCKAWPLRLGSKVTARESQAV